ncbi:hypothetical protein HNQ50_003869 [Silvimonas terrae]|uniref:Uncharacterized protein n=1 Tax=Silvimonas terrae TaxID=300266 RepID=A0A840RIG8_9NEIS|nr:hypothetical protein [Silvimonas terrae]MBB5193115.1 hypothetical protein [Silvimonas terrae]
MKHQIVLSAGLFLLAVAAILLWPVPPAAQPAAASSQAGDDEAWLQSHLAATPAKREGGQ